MAMFRKKIPELDQIIQSIRWLSLTEIKKDFIDLGIVGGGKKQGG